MNYIKKEMDVVGNDNSYTCVQNESVSYGKVIIFLFIYKEYLSTLILYCV